MNLCETCKHRIIIKCAYPVEPGHTIMNARLCEYTGWDVDYARVGECSHYEKNPPSEEERIRLHKEFTEKYDALVQEAMEGW